MLLEEGLHCFQEDFQKLNVIKVLSLLLQGERRGADRSWGFGATVAFIIELQKMGRHLASRSH